MKELRSIFLNKIYYLKEKIYNNDNNNFCKNLGIKPRTLLSWDYKNLDTPTTTFLNNVNNINKNIKKTISLDDMSIQDIGLYSNDFTNNISFDLFKNKINLFIKNKHSKYDNIIGEFYLQMYINDKAELIITKFFIDKDNNNLSFKILKDKFYPNSHGLFFKKEGLINLIATDTQILINFKPKTGNLICSLNLNMVNIDSDIDNYNKNNIPIFFTGYLTYIDDENKHVTTKVILSPKIITDSNITNVLLKNRTISFNKNYIKLINRQYCYQNKILKEDILFYLHQIEEAYYNRFIDYNNMLSQLDTNNYLIYFKELHTNIHSISNNIVNGEDYVFHSKKSAEAIFLHSLYKKSLGCMLYEVIDDNSFCMNDSSEANLDINNDHIFYDTSLFNLVENQYFTFEQIFAVELVDTYIKLSHTINYLISYNAYIFINTTKNILADENELQLFLENYLSDKELKNYKYSKGINIDKELTSGHFTYFDEIEDIVSITKNKDRLSELYKEFVFLKSKSKPLSGSEHKIVLNLISENKNIKYLKDIFALLP
jgi:hypothetical protein